jgi:hypothetical protein
MSNTPTNTPAGASHGVPPSGVEITMPDCKPPRVATPATDPTDQPSAGAVRAALALANPTVRFCYTQTDPSLSRARLAASEEIYDVARLIDRETHAKELLAACKLAATSDSNIAKATDKELVDAAINGNAEVRRGAIAVLALREAIHSTGGKA